MVIYFPIVVPDYRTQSQTRTVRVNIDERAISQLHLMLMPTLLNDKMHRRLSRKPIYCIWEILQCVRHSIAVSVQDMI